MSLDMKTPVAERRLKLITVFSFIIITLALILLYDTPVNGYEISIYNSIPIFVWIAMAFGLINGGLLFYLYYEPNKKLWIIGLFEILLCNIIVISLNDLRGSIYLGYGDPLSYIGYSRDIILSFHIPDYNFYPLSSLLTSFTSLTTNQTLIESVQLLPAFLLTIYTLSILAWSKSICRERGFIAAMLLASLPLFFAWFIPPIYYETIYVLLIPIFLFSVQRGKSGDIRFISITFALFVFFTLGHPLVALFLLLYLIIIFVIERSAKLEKKTVSINLILFSCVIFLSWVGVQVVLTNQVTNVMNQIFSFGANQTTFISFENSASKLGFLATLQSLFACTIDDLIFILLSLWAAIIIWKNAWRTNQISKYLACFLLGSVFLLALIVITLVHNPFRLANLNINMVLSLPLVGFLLYHKKKKGKLTTARLIIVLILISLIASTFSVYQDPVQVFPNGTITISEASGVNWFIDLKEIDINTSTLQTLPGRFGDMIYGHVYVIDNARSFITNDTASHFTTIMSSNRTIGSTYLIISSFDREAYSEVWKSTDKFTDNDFRALSFSIMIEKTFDNGGFSCYFRN